MIIGIPKETFPGERRVALVPSVASTLTKKEISVLMETASGDAAGFPNAEYEKQGVRIAPDRGAVFAAADVIVQVRCYGANPVAGRGDLDLVRPDQTIIGFADPLGAPSMARELSARGATSFALELLPRITRAQGMDALSSQATVAGYRAVILAAEVLPRMFPMLMTAAGTVTAARVLILGAGVAGLQAIATARRLGAVVQAYDVRPAVKEQVQSLGAKFVELELEGGEGTGGYARTMNEEFYRKQRELLARVIAKNDVVIATAAVPGSKAPLLVTEEAVRGMPPGSVIVDLAAERGGNCELTQAGQTVMKHGVNILGPLNLPADAPYHASQMYAKNLSNFLLLLIKDGSVQLDSDDEIIRETMVTRGGQVVNPKVLQALEAGGK